LYPGEEISKTEFIRRFSGTMMITSMADKQNIANVCIGKGFVMERSPKEGEKFGQGVSKVVKLPPEPTEDDHEKEQGELF